MMNVGVRDGVGYPGCSLLLFVSDERQARC